MSEKSDSEFIVRGPQSFGSAVREFRLGRGLSQAELAERSGLHRTYLSSVENGSTTEALRNLMRVLNLLDLDVVIRPRRRAVD
jgi:transcriptional regulator with XRE-family HTH domain